MIQDISLADNADPEDLGMLPLKFERNIACRFSDYLRRTLYCELKHSILKVVLEAL